MSLVINKIKYYELFSLFVNLVTIEYISCETSNFFGLYYFKNRIQADNHSKMMCTYYILLDGASNYIIMVLILHYILYLEQLYANGLYFTA